MTILHRTELAHLGATFALRRAEPRRDLDALHTWMHEPHVVPFWQLNVSRADLGTYLERVLANPDQEPLIGCLDGEPVGYFEVYRTRSSPLADCERLAPHDQGVHLLIGPPEHTGRGLGPLLLRAVVEWQFACDPHTARVAAEPDARNRQSIRAFERCGFRRVTEVELDDKRAALLIVERAELSPSLEPCALTRSSRGG